MNRKDWEAQVFASNLSMTARLVALVAGSFGNWTEDRTVWAGTSVISGMAGLTRDTTQDYLDAFVEQGWLKIVGRRGRAAEYELCTPVAEPIGILAKTKRKMNPKSLAHLKVGKDGTVADAIGNTESGPVADTTGVVADTTGDGLPIRQVPIADTFGTNLKEHKDMNIKEHKDTTVSDEPMVPEVREGASNPSLTTNIDHPALTVDSRDAADIWPWTYNGVRYMTERQMKEAMRQDELTKEWDAL